MKHIIHVMVVSIVLTHAACTVPSQSSGFVTSPRQSLPAGVPVRVAVVLSGEMPICMQASEQFSGGLLNLGFDVIERQHINSVLSEQALSNSKLVDATTAVEIGKLLGAEGMFVGTVTGESDGIAWVDSHVNIKLVDVQKGKAIWSAYLMAA